MRCILKFYIKYKILYFVYHIRLFFGWITGTPEKTPEGFKYKRPDKFVAQGKYVEGKKHGEFRTYNIKGEVVLIELYDKGVPYLTKHYGLGEYKGIDRNKSLVV